MRRCFYVIVFACAATLLAGAARAQMIETVAGNRVWGFCGDGGPAVSACVWPAAVAVDASGNVYISDWFSHRVRRVDVFGTITTIAGGDGYPDTDYCDTPVPAISPCLTSPGALAVDPAGDVFIADSGAGRVRKIDPSGLMTKVAGGHEFGGDGGPATDARLNSPAGIALDAWGNLFIAETYNHSIRKVDTAGIITTVVHATYGRFCGDNGPAIDACLNRPHAIAVDPAGNLFIADTGNNRVRKIDLTGTITTVAGNGVGDYCGDGGAATAACLDRPTDVGVNAAGDLFISDYSNHRIRMVSTDGRITTVAGRYRPVHLPGMCVDGPATRTCLDWPVALAAEPNGSVLFAESGPGLVRRIDFLSPAVTLGDTATSGCRSTTGRVALVSPAPPGGTVVTLRSDNVHAAVPPSIVVRAASRTQSFAITTTAVDDVEMAHIDATVFGSTSPSIALTLRPMGPASVTIAPNPIAGGARTTGIVSLECAAGPGDVWVTLTSTKPAIATPVESVIRIPSGETTAPFTITTVPVTDPKTPAIKATVNGRTRSIVLTVNPGP